MMGDSAVRLLLTQIAAFVIGAGVFGLIIGVGLGRLGRRDPAPAVAPDPLRPQIVERVVVRPDPALFEENERLRDRVAALEATALMLRKDVSAAEERATEANLVAAAAQAARETLVSKQVGLMLAGSANGCSATGPARAAESATASSDRTSDRTSLDGPAASPRSSDDLTQIPGVGAALAVRLGQQGIHTYEDVARLTPSDLDRIARVVGVSVWRMRRQRWVERARALVDV